MMDFEKQLVHGSPWQNLLRRPRSPERFHKNANIMANKINQMRTIWKIPCAYHLVTCWILDDAPIKNQMMCWCFTELFGFRAKQKELQALQADFVSFTEPETIQAIVVHSEKCCDNHAHHLGFATWHAWFLRNMNFLPIYKCNSALDIYIVSRLWSTNQMIYIYTCIHCNYEQTNDVQLYLVLKIPWVL